MESWSPSTNNGNAHRHSAALQRCCSAEYTSFRATRTYSFQATYAGDCGFNNSTSNTVTGSTLHGIDPYLGEPRAHSRTALR